MPVIGYITGTEIFSVVSVEYIFYCSQMYLSSNLHMSSLNALGHSRTPHRGFFFSYAYKWFSTRQAVWIIFVSQKFICKILIPSAMIFGGEAFGWWLDHEGSTCMNEISAFMKEMAESSFVPSAMWGHSRKMAIFELGNGLC